VDGLGLQDRDTLWVKGDPEESKPIPVSVSAVGELAALLINETPPEMEADVCGAKVTVKETLCPAVSVTGKEMPLIENPSPLQLPDEIVTGDMEAVSFAV
jgi:hypothetical protein